MVAFIRIYFATYISIGHVCYVLPSLGALHQNMTITIQHFGLHVQNIVNILLIQQPLISPDMLNQHCHVSYHAYIPERYQTQLKWSHQSCCTVVNKSDGCGRREGGEKKAKRQLHSYLSL